MITSKSNEQIKYIKSLNDKKYRKQYSKYLLEGIKLIEEISSEGKHPELIIYSEDLLKSAAGGKKLLEKIQKEQLKVVEIIEVSKSVFESITDTVSPQGIMAVMNIKQLTQKDLTKEIMDGENFIILDKIQDSGNLGTIIRTALSFGIKNIICTDGTADIYSPKAIRSTMGAINKINIWYLNYEELGNIVYILKESKYILAGTDLKSNIMLKEFNPIKKTIYVLGNESQGVDNKLKDMCNLNVKIPQEKDQESLNVGVATGILLYDWYVRQT